MLVIIGFWGPGTEIQRHKGRKYKAARHLSSLGNGDVVEKLTYVPSSTASCLSTVISLPVRRRCAFLSPIRANPTPYLPARMFPVMPYHGLACFCEGHLSDPAPLGSLHNRVWTGNSQPLCRFVHGLPNSVCISDDRSECTHPSDPKCASCGPWKGSTCP